MNQFDRELVKYFLAWLPFSGPEPGDVFARFGMSCARAAEILLSVTTRGHQTLSTRSEDSNSAETAADQRLLKELIDNIDQIRSFCIDTRIGR